MLHWEVRMLMEPLGNLEPRTAMHRLHLAHHQLESVMSENTVEVISGAYWVAHENMMKKARGGRKKCIRANARDALAHTMRLRQ